MLLETLFGGVLAVVVIYLLLGLLEVSHYWRGVMSGGIPTLAYVGYSLVHWGGGDVLSIHVAVYLATAVGMALIMGKEKAPGQRMHWIPKLFSFLLVLLMVVMGVLVYIAGSGVPDSVAKWLLPVPKSKVRGEVSTGFAGVVHHGNEAAKEVNSYQAKLNKEKKLGWNVVVDGIKNLRVGQQSIVRATVLDAAGKPLAAEVWLVVMRPGAEETTRNDIVMSPVGSGKYQAVIEPPGAGNWTIGIHIEAGKDVLDSEQIIPVS